MIYYLLLVKDGLQKMGKKGKNKEYKEREWRFNQESKNITQNEKLFEDKFTYLCAGTFLISIYLIKDVIREDNIQCIWILFSSWIFLIIALLINLWSCFYTNRLSNKLLQDMEEHWNEEDYFENNLRKRNERNIGKTNRINIASASCFTVGIVLMLIFAIINQ